MAGEVEEFAGVDRRPVEGSTVRDGLLRLASSLGIPDADKLGDNELVTILDTVVRTRSELGRQDIGGAGQLASGGGGSGDDGGGAGEGEKIEKFGGVDISEFDDNLQKVFNYFEERLGRLAARVEEVRGVAEAGRLKERFNAIFARYPEVYGTEWGVEGSETFERRMAVLNYIQSVVKNPGPPEVEIPNATRRLFGALLNRGGGRNTASGTVSGIAPTGRAAGGSGSGSVRSDRVAIQKISELLSSWSSSSSGTE